MKLIQHKGYTITVVSWENDADNYNTKSIVVETKEEAKVYWDMMQLCKSKNKSGVLGNSFDSFTEKQEKIAKDFIKEHHKILLPDDNIEENEDNLVDWFCDLAGRLLGHSENYRCRVMESCTITYSDKDIYLEEVIF